MARIIIEGNRPLHGMVKVSGAKNAVLKLMAAALLAKGTFVIENVPRIKDVETMMGVLDALGAKCRFCDSNALEIEVGEIHGESPASLAKGMRASIQVLGPLLARLGWVKTSMPGGCAIGPRPVDLHLDNLRIMGAEICEEGDQIVAKAVRLRGSRLRLKYPSVGATENLMMAATLAQGDTVIENAAREPEIVDVQNFLNAMGARVRGAGTSRIEIRGVSALHGTSYRVIPDRIETGTFMLAAASTRGKVLVERTNPQHVWPLIRKMREAEVDVRVIGDDIMVNGSQRPRSANILTLPYPGFPTDLQPQFMALMSVAEGTSVIKETVYANRMRHAAELKRMGANIVVDGNTAVVCGVEQLTGTSVQAFDLRGGAALLVAGLSADGQTVVSGVEHIDRGYENLISKLRSVGARVWREG